MSIYISYEHLVDSEAKNAFDIPIGTVFTGKIGNYTHKLFLRAYENVISLDEPNSTWHTRNRESSPRVMNYREVHIDIFVKPIEDE